MHKLLCGLLLLIAGIGQTHGMELEREKRSFITLPQTYHYFSQCLLPEIAQCIFSLQLGGIDLAILPFEIEQSCESPEAFVQLIHVLIKSCGYNLAYELFKRFFPHEKSICDIKNKNWETVLHCAVLRDSMQEVRFILDIASYNVWTLLIAKTKRFEKTVLYYVRSGIVAKLLLDAAGKNTWILLTMSNGGDLALHEAALRGRTEVIGCFLNAAGSDAWKLLTMRNRIRSIVLPHAVQSKNPETVQMILDFAGNKAWTLLSMQDGCGSTALHSAAYRDDVEMVKLLLKAAGDKVEEYVAMTTDLGKTAFDEAKPAGQEALKPYISDSCCSVLYPDCVLF